MSISHDYLSKSKQTSKIGCNTYDMNTAHILSGGVCMGKIGDKYHFDVNGNTDYCILFNVFVFFINETPTIILHSEYDYKHERDLTYVEVCASNGHKTEYINL
jgi:hypothetical protein